MSTHLVLVVVDSNDPGELARWWSEALGWPITQEDDEEVVVAPVDHLAGQVPVLVFGRVPEPKTVKNRVHLDLGSRDAEHQAEQVARLLGMGATRADVGQASDVTWVVLADPEGNELCVLRGDHEEGNPLSAICLDAVDHRALADYWVQASGWQVEDQDDEGTILRNPNGHRPTLDLLAVPEAHTTKNRLHLDVAPPAGADHDAEVERLLAAGATRADVGQTGEETWTVLADPEGNESCVLSPRDLKDLGPR